MFSITNNNPDKELTILRIYLAHPTEKEATTGAFGWDGTQWRPRENLGAFLVNVKNNETQLTSEEYTFDIPESKSLSFILRYKLFDEKTRLSWKNSFLTVEYIAKGKMHFIMSKITDRNKGYEDVYLLK